MCNDADQCPSVVYFILKHICTGFISVMSICVAIEDPVIKRRVGIPLTGLTPPYCCVCLKPEPGFVTLFLVVFFMFSELNGEVIVPFVDIG